MYPHQSERLTEVLQREQVNALVATTPANVSYVSNYESLVQAIYRHLPFFAVFTPEATALVVPALDAATVAAAGPRTDHVRCYGRFAYAEGERPGEAGDRILGWMREATATPGEALGAALAALRVSGGRIGLDEGGLSASAWRDVTARLPAFTVIEAGAHFAGARIIKSPWEIECLERALHIAEEAANEVVQVLKPGVTEREATALFDAAVARRGARPYCTTILMGERSAFPAAAVSDRALRAGELVRLDFGCIYQGYCSDVSRTAVMGEPDRRQLAVHEAIAGGLEAALAAIRPGVAAGRVFDVAVEATRKAGLARYDRHHVGHGIGLDPWEPPTLAPGATTTLEPGMVLRVETPYYEPGWGGVHIKDTILITRIGCHVMNRSSHGLVHLD